MKRANMIMFLIAGLGTCGLSTAATTITVSLPTANALSVISAIGMTSKIRLGVQTMRLLPEVHVGDGNRNGFNAIEENDEPLEDVQDELQKDAPQN